MPKDSPVSPAHSASSQNEDQSLENIVALLRQQQQRAAQSHRKKQQAILDEGKELSRQYELSVKAVLDEGKDAEQKRVQQFKDEEARLRAEIGETEKELLELLQVEASSVQLGAAAAQAEVEDWKSSQQATLAALSGLADEEAKGIDTAVGGLWQPSEQAEGEGDGGPAAA